MQTFGLHDKHGSVTNKKPPRRVGLARALSKLGYCSRSDAADLIRAGRVRLNGAVPEGSGNTRPDGKGSDRS